MFKKNINLIRKNIVKFLILNYPNCNIKRENLSLLNEGKFANATVFRYKDKNLDLTIKDFLVLPGLLGKHLENYL